VTDLDERHGAAKEVIAATWVCVRAGRVLGVRPYGQDAFYLPGGTPEPGETLAQTTVREVAEEVGIHLDPATVVPLFELTAPAYGRPGTTVRLVCFQAPSDAEPAPLAEIEEVAWLSTADTARCAPAVQGALERLATHGLFSVG
jgi:8-oxo-dGTP diphosphatase